MTLNSNKLTPSSNMHLQRIADGNVFEGSIYIPSSLTIDDFCEITNEEYQSIISQNNELTQAEIGNLLKKQIIVKTCIDDVLDVNCDYYLGEQSIIKLNFPQYDIFYGDVIYLNFTTNNNPTTIILKHKSCIGLNNFIPVENTNYRIECRYNGSNWICSVTETK